LLQILAKYRLAKDLSETKLKCKLNYVKNYKILIIN